MGLIRTRREKSVARIQELHHELITRGIPTKAKVKRRIGRGFSEEDDHENFFLDLEVLGQDGKTYNVKKYRPWLPFRSDVLDGPDRRPYYWNIPQQFEDRFVNGAVLPVRVHPEVPLLLDFEINFGESGLHIAPYQFDYPDAFDRWKNGEEDTTLQKKYFSEQLAPPPLSLAMGVQHFNDIFNFFARRKHSRLILILEKELKDSGILGRARIIRFARHISNAENPLNRWKFYSNRFFIEMEIHRPDAEPYVINKYRPWNTDSDFGWYFDDDHLDEMDRLETGAVFSVIIHPRIPDMVDFEFNRNRIRNERSLPLEMHYDYGYNRKRFEKWYSHAKIQGWLPNETIRKDA